MTSQNAISQVNLDSLRDIINYQKGEQKLRSIELLTYYLQYQDIEEYHEYAKLGLEQALAERDSSYVAVFLIELGYYSKIKGDYQRALNNLNRAKHIVETKGYRKVATIVYTALGTLYHELGFYDKALDFHSKSLVIKEEMKDKREIGVSYTNIGLIYYKIDDAPRAIDYFERSIAIRLELFDTARTIVPYINLGLAYSSLNGYENKSKAIACFKEAIRISIGHNQLYRLGFAYNGIAQVHISSFNYDSARYYLRLSNEESLKNNYKQLESSNYFLLAKIYYQEQKYEEAIANLVKSQQLLEWQSDKQRVKNNFGLFSDIYAAQNMMDSAYHYQKLFSVMKDSIFNEELANNLANVQIATIEEQSQRKLAMQEQVISKSKFFSLFLLSILALSVALIVVIFKNYAQTNKINRQLNESRNEIQAQKEDLERKNQQLAEAQITIQNQNEVLKNINEELDKKVKERTAELGRSNRGLEKAVHDLDQFIYKTSHDLRGPIATMQGIINLGVMSAGDEVSKGYFNTLHNVSNNLNNILYRLIEVHETYQKKPLLEPINPGKEINDITTKLAQYNSDPDISIISELTLDGSWKSDVSLFRVIVENMIRNAIHYKDRGQLVIRIIAAKVDQSLIIVVEDNGFGIQAGDEDKVFNIFFKGYPRPGGTGLEVYTAKVAVEKLGGMIRLVKPKKNTVYEIMLPEIQSDTNPLS